MKIFIIIIVIYFIIINNGSDVMSVRRNHVVPLVKHYFAN